jgi:hypothetical protein
VLEKLSEIILRKYLVNVHYKPLNQISWRISKYSETPKEEMKEQYKSNRDALSQNSISRKPYRTIDDRNKANFSANISLREKNLSNAIPLNV